MLANHEAMLNIERRLLMTLLQTHCRCWYLAMLHKNRHVTVYESHDVMLRESRHENQHRLVHVGDTRDLMPDHLEHKDSAEDISHIDPPHEGSTGISLTYSPVKLPKLSLKKFNGELTKWTTFWDTFESSVHKNPVLTDIDKFSYLISLLESTASDAIAGLTLTSANYGEAVAVLKRRFWNRQAIIYRHMDILLHLEAVTSVYNSKGLRQLFDTVELNVRGLKTIRVAASSYGGLLSSILMSRLPSELCLIVSRKLGEEEGDIEAVMKIFQREIEARECSARAMPLQRKMPPQRKGPPTVMSLATSASATPAICAYCSQPHSSDSCQTVRDPEERKRTLQVSGCYFVCLRRNHLGRNCRTAGCCFKCNRRHHTSICSTSSYESPPASSTMTNTHRPQPSVLDGAHRVLSTASMYVNSHKPVLLQTAKATVSDASQPYQNPSLMVRAILDTGSQRSYVTTQVKEILKARRSHLESMVIKTFGSEQGEKRVCNIIQLKFITMDDESIVLPMVVVPHICNPVSVQPIDASKVSYEHLQGLEMVGVHSTLMC